MIARFVLIRALGLVVVLWVLGTIVLCSGRWCRPTGPGLCRSRASPEVIASKRQELGLDKPLLTATSTTSDRSPKATCQNQSTRADGCRRPTGSTSSHAGTVACLSWGDRVLGLGVGVATLVRVAARCPAITAVAGTMVPIFTSAYWRCSSSTTSSAGSPPAVRPRQGRSRCPDRPDSSASTPCSPGMSTSSSKSFGTSFCPQCACPYARLLTARTLRSSLRHSLRQDYVRTARAKGLSERQVLWRHASATP